MNRDLKILEFNDETEVDSSQTEEIRQDMTDLKEGDRVTIYYDDQNVIYRVEIEPEEEDQGSPQIKSLFPFNCPWRFCGDIQCNAGNMIQF